MPPPGRRPARLIAAFLVVCATLLAAAAPALAARPPIHAHRGGPLEFGKPTYGENTLPAFRAAARRGFVLELDAKLTKDGVPVVIHDATLDRTTPCTGQVNARTYAELLADCRSDILGTDANFVQLGPNDRRRARIPTLSEVLALARFTGARVNLEIKNQPGDADFDNTSAFANAVIDAVERSGFPPSRLIVQSFWFPNLELVKQRIPVQRPASSPSPARARTSASSLRAVTSGSHRRCRWGRTPCRRRTRWACAWSRTHSTRAS